jgi:hypothetical protein
VPRQPYLPYTGPGGTAGLPFSEMQRLERENYERELQRRKEVAERQAKSWTWLQAEAAKRAQRLNLPLDWAIHELWNLAQNPKSVIHGTYLAMGGAAAKGLGAPADYQNQRQRALKREAQKYVEDHVALLQQTRNLPRDWAEYELYVAMGKSSGGPRNYWQMLQGEWNPPKPPGYQDEIKRLELRDPQIQVRGELAAEFDKTTPFPAGLGLSGSVSRWTRFAASGGTLPDWVGYTARQFYQAIPRDAQGRIAVQSEEYQNFMRYAREDYNYYREQWIKERM